MEPDENTQDEELEEQDPDAEEEDESPVDDEPSDEAPDRKLSYEEKLAGAKDDAERFRIANAEAAKQRRLAAKARKTPVTTTDRSTEPTQPSTDVDTVDERVLRAQGMDQKLLDELKVIAKVRGVSLLDAQNDDLFVAAKEKFEKEKKRKEAGAGPSRGSGSPRPQKTVATPGLSREEHKRASGYAK